MKKLTYLASLAALMLFASCSSDTEDFNAQNMPKAGEKMTVGASIKAEGTRLEFPNDILTNMKWSSWDALYAVTEKYGNSMWFLKTGAGTSDATFEGTIEQYQGYGDEGTTEPIDPNTPITFMNIGWHQFEGSAIKYKYNDQNQSAPNTTVEGLGHYVILESAPITYAELNKGAKLSMKPVNSILKLNVINLPDMIKDKEKLTIKYFVNYAKGVESIATMHLGSKITAGSDNFIYIAFDPATALKAKNNIAFEISDGLSIIKVSAVSKEGKVYQAGKIYTATLDYKQNGKDNWTWDVPAAPFYTKVFDNLDGWKADSFDGSYWCSNQAYGPGTSEWVAAGWGDKSIDTYLTSDPIDLKPTANFVEFHHAMASVPFEERAQQAQLLVREVIAPEQYGEWAAIEGINYNNTDEWGPVFVSSGKLKINGFDGKKVQLAFKMSKGTNQYITWNIRDIMLFDK